MAASKKWSDHAVEILLEMFESEDAKELIKRLRGIENANASVTMTLENIDKRLQARNPG